MSLARSVVVSVVVMLPPSARSRVVRSGSAFLAVEGVSNDGAQQPARRAGLEARRTARHAYVRPGAPSEWDEAAVHQNQPDDHTPKHQDDHREDDSLEEVG